MVLWLGIFSRVALSYRSFLFAVVKNLKKHTVLTASQALSQAVFSFCSVNVRVDDIGLVLVQICRSCVCVPRDIKSNAYHKIQSTDRMLDVDTVECSDGSSVRDTRPYMHSSFTQIYRINRYL